MFEGEMDGVRRTTKAEGEGEVKGKQKWGVGAGGKIRNDGRGKAEKRYWEYKGKGM